MVRYCHFVFAAITFLGFILNERRFLAGRCYWLLGVLLYGCPTSLAPLTRTVISAAKSSVYMIITTQVVIAVPPQIPNVFRLLRQAV